MNGQLMVVKSQVRTECRLFLSDPPNRTFTLTANMRSRELLRTRSNTLLPSVGSVTCWCKWVSWSRAMKSLLVGLPLPWGKGYEELQFMSE